MNHISLPEIEPRLIDRINYLKVRGVVATFDSDREAASQALSGVAYRKSDRLLLRDSARWTVTADTKLSNLVVWATLCAFAFNNMPIAIGV